MEQDLEVIKRINSVVADICANKSPTKEDIELLIPQFQILKKTVSIIEDHLKERVIKNGEEFNGIKTKKGATRKNIPSTKRLESFLSEWMGEDFNKQRWERSLSMTAGNLEDFICSCYDTTKTSKAGKDILEGFYEAAGDVIEKKQNSDSLVIK